MKIICVYDALNASTQSILTDYSPFEFLLLKYNVQRARLPVITHVIDVSAEQAKQWQAKEFPVFLRRDQT